MSDSDEQQQFWNLVDQLLEQANQLGDSHNSAMVSDALLYAAARFNAYTMAAGAEDRKSFKEEQGEMFEDLVSQFKTMLGANMDDYLENYKIYMREE